MKRIWIRTAAVVLLAGASGIAVGADAGSATALQTEAQSTDTLSARHGQARVQSRIASEFSTLAGSSANAHGLVTGLRDGAPITLRSTSTTTGGTTTTTLLTFDTPTRPMGYGNVFISLALAEQVLARHGITHPTPGQIEAALNGGTIATASGETVALQGVLTQRASGQGWGAIARSQGVKLGAVVSALKGANQQVSASAATTPGASGAALVSPRAAPASAATQATAAGGRSSPHAGGALSGSAKGIVSAGGPGGGVGAGTGTIVTGAGGSVRGVGSVPGLAKGHSKP